MGRGRQRVRETSDPDPALVARLNDPENPHRHREARQFLELVHLQRNHTHRDPSALATQRTCLLWLRERALQDNRSRALDLVSDLGFKPRIHRRVIGDIKTATMHVIPSPQPRSSSRPLCGAALSDYRWTQFNLGSWREPANDWTRCRDCEAHSGEVPECADPRNYQPLPEKHMQRLHKKLTAALPERLSQQMTLSETPLTDSEAQLISDDAYTIGLASGLAAWGREQPHLYESMLSGGWYGGYAWAQEAVSTAWPQKSPSHQIAALCNSRFWQDLITAEELRGASSTPHRWCAQQLARKIAERAQRQGVSEHPIFDRLRGVHLPA